MTVLGFVLQTAALFASWRLGLARTATLRGALLHGLVVGVAASLAFGLILLVIGFVFAKITALVAAVAVLAAFVALFGLVWTAYAAVFSVGICIMFLLALAVGARMGDMTFAATIVGGSGFVWTLLVAAAFVLLWLSSRFSCTAVLMAERKSLNVWAAMRESWSLTWEDEWRITRYLALLGLVVAVALVGVLVIVQLAVGATLVGASGQIVVAYGAALMFILYLPLAYLSVMVPVGIYRALSPADVARAEVFV